MSRGYCAPFFRQPTTHRAQPVPVAPSPPPVTEEQVQRFLNSLSEAERVKMNEIARQQAQMMGYARGAEGSAAWGRAMRMAAVKIIQAGLSVGEIEYCD